jgi:hypothetical protein
MSFKLLTIAAAVVAMSAATQARAELTLVEQAGSGVDLSDIHVGQTFTLDTLAEGPAGEHITYAEGGFLAASGSVKVDSIDVGPNPSADLSTDPVLYITTFTAEQAAPARAYLSFANGEIGTNEGTYSPTSNTVSFTVLPAVSAAPEPSAWALLMLGVAGIGLMLRRARRTPGFRWRDCLARA